MDIQITRREVLNNLIRFKDSLLELEGRTHELFEHERSYAILVNRHTGDIRFTRNIETLGRQFPLTPTPNFSPSDWEEIRLLAEDQNEAVHFRITGTGGSTLNPKNLDPLAIRILFETLDVLNHLASLYHPVLEQLPENTVLEHLSDLHIAAIPEPVESVRGWSGKMGRIEAEKTLFGLPRGSYLIRMGDQVVENVSDAFATSNRMKVKLYVLTFVESEGHIGEHLLMETDWGWTLVKDESNLSSPLYEYHPSLSSLIRSLSHQLKTPI